MNLSLKLDWCSFQAAKYAVMKWHYSHAMPYGKLVKIGVWENEKFIGVIIFSCGACPVLGNSYKLNRFEICELTRIALNKHVTPVSRMISISLKMLNKLCPKLKLVISFADTNQDHNGGIYQAGNWLYLGETARVTQYIINGKKRHERSVFHQCKGDKTIKRIKAKIKYRYAMPLNNDIREKIMKLSKPYPKREKIGNHDDQS